MLIFVLLSAPVKVKSGQFPVGARSPAQGKVIYFLLPDRFSRDSSSNLVPDRNNGFDPTDIDFFHGGTIKGITNRWKYLQDLGVNLLWIAPVFRNQPIHDYGGGVLKTGYHGYWILDFTDVDPHFGSKADLCNLANETKERGIGLILDTVVNHTANVLKSKSGSRAYQYKFSKPYRDANGTPFDDRDYLFGKQFPKLDAAVSFPLIPVFAEEADQHAKKPDWLNDPTVYHNRGEVSSAGESALYGDLPGTDDLFTEQPRVVSGMIAIYQNWIRDVDLAGLRLDTVKHVNNEFWQQFVPAMEQQAARSGRANFLIFGEIYDPDPAILSDYVHRAGISSVLDFGFQKTIVDFASGEIAPSVVADFFAKDSYYTTAKASAQGLITFLGNHDIGRIGHFLLARLPDSSDNERLARDTLAHSLLFLLRGIPAIYYGDEQGFTGQGGDAFSREDMFQSSVPVFEKENRIGGGRGDAFNEANPIYQKLRELIGLRRANVSLQSGLQIVRYSSDKPGIFAVSRVDPDSRKELLIIFNNATTRQTATFMVPATGWEPIYSSSPVNPSVKAEHGQVTIEAAPLSCAIFKASENSPVGGLGELRLNVSRTSELDGRWEVKAEENSFCTVSFQVRAKGIGEFVNLGIADSPPYRIFPCWEEVPNASELEFRAVATDLNGDQREVVVSWAKKVRALGK
ncbi:MAG: alpha-amylase [Verrucomicrobia bacterium]|nr:alpha-amylase [Verrucomicrobiota bacterium]